MLHLVDDAVGEPAEYLVGDLCPVGGHEVVGGDGADGDQLVIGARVAHDADRLDARKHHKELTQLLGIAAFLHLVAQNRVRLLQGLDALGGDLADDAHAQPRTRERLAPYQLVRQSELFADGAHLVLEQILERLDHALETDVRGHAHLIVMGLDLGGVALAALDAVGIDRALREEARAVAVADLVPEHVIEFGADDPALLLGVGHAAQLREEFLLTVDADKVHVKQLGEGLLHIVALVLAHQPLIDEHAGELSADRLAQQRRGDGAVDAARESEHHALVPHLLSDLRDCGVDEIVHPPLALAAADAVEEVPQHVAAVLGVVDLGVELHAVELLFLVRHRRHGAVRGGRGDGEAVGHLVDVVAVAHP